MNAGPDTTDIAARAVGIGVADEPKGQAMTNPDDLERAVERLELATEEPSRNASFTLTADLRLILAANRKMRENDCSRFVFVEELAKATFAQKYGPSVWQDANETLRRYWISRTQDAIQIARSALSTKEQPDV